MKTNPQIKHEISKVKISSRIRNFSEFSHEFHLHRNYEIIQILEQSCYFLIDGTLIEASEGDIVTIGENIVHQFINRQSSARIRILQFSLKNLLDAGIPIQPLKIHITADEIGKIPQLHQMLDAMFEIIDREGGLDDVSENHFQKSVLNALYCLLTRYFTEETLPVPKKEHQDFWKILNYINDHFTEDLNIGILSERLFLYRDRLSTIFHKYSGMTLNEYISSLRIKKANDLLKQGCSITDAAMQSGFQSIRTFNHIYKKVTGITPTEYKNGHVPQEE